MDGNIVCNNKSVEKSKFSIRKHEKLPTVYRDTYHKLIQKGMQFIFMSLLAKRGREGIDKVEKNDFKKCYDEDGDYYFWTRVIIRRTKNHQ